ncbi:MAG: hypothetical protein V1781_02260 [Bacteroidota bacterium]
MNSSTQSVISEYINEYARSPIYSRGVSIYNSRSRIISFNVDNEKRDANYIIMGSSGNRYAISIHDFDKNISCSCNCPYDWGGICKHQVAALLHLKNYLENGNASAISKKQIVQKRNSNEMYYIKNYESLTNEKVYSHCVAKGYYTVSMKLLHIHPEERKAEFQANEDFNWRPHSVIIVTIHIHPSEGLGFVCNCNKKVEQLCEHASEVLKQIAIKNKLSDFIVQLQPKYLENKKKGNTERVRTFGRYIV